MGPPRTVGFPTLHPQIRTPTHATTYAITLPPYFTIFHHPATPPTRYPTIPPHHQPATPPSHYLTIPLSSPSTASQRRYCHRDRDGPDGGGDTHPYFGGEFGRALRDDRRAQHEPHRATGASRTAQPQVGVCLPGTIRTVCNAQVNTPQAKVLIALY